MKRPFGVDTEPFKCALVHGGLVGPQWHPKRNGYGFKTLGRKCLRMEQLRPRNLFDICFSCTTGENEGTVVEDYADPDKSLFCQEIPD